MTTYCDAKRPNSYDSNFGDVVPVVLANALNCKLTIVHTDSLDSNNRLRVSVIAPTSHLEEPSICDITIAKVGQHYNALKPL